jgi:hypothetical protein
MFAGLVKTKREFLEEVDKVKRSEKTNLCYSVF